MIRKPMFWAGLMLGLAMAWCLRSPELWPVVGLAFLFNIKEAPQAAWTWVAVYTMTTVSGSVFAHWLAKKIEGARCRSRSPSASSRSW